MKKKQTKIKYVDTAALLRKMDSDFEIHLKYKEPTFLGGNIFPLGFLQKLVYRFLRWEYIDGVEYINLMSERFENKDFRGCK